MPTITGTVTQFEWDQSTPPRIRIYAKVPFITGDGVPVLAGSPYGGRAYVDEPCTLNVDNRVVVPDVIVPYTEDSLDKPDTAEYTAFLYSRGASLGEQYQEFSVFGGGFRVPLDGDPLTWEDIALNMGNPSGPLTPADRTVNNLTVNEDADIAGDLAVGGRTTSAGGYAGLLAGDVELALGYVPRNSLAPTVNTFQGRSGAVVLQSSDLNGLSLAGTTGLGSGTGGVINTGSTTVGADSDADGLGVVALQTRGLNRLLVNNDGTVEAVQNYKTGVEKGIIFQSQNVPFAMHVASAVFNGVRDDVGYWGFNLVPGSPSARANTSEPQLKFGLEQHWFDGTTAHWSEFNLDWMNADGVTLKRLQSFHIDRNTNLASWNFLSENFSLSSDTLDEYVKFTPSAGLTMRGWTLDSRDLSGAGFTYPTFRSEDPAQRTELCVMPNGAAADPGAAVVLYTTDYRTDSTNWERMAVYAESTRYRFAPEKGGTGSLRAFHFGAASAGNNPVEIDATGALDVLSAAGRTRLRAGSDGDGTGTYAYQIAFGHAGGDNYRQYLRTRHSSSAGGNAIDLLTSDGVAGNGIGTAVLGLTINNGAVGVGTDAPDAKAVLELASTARGFLPPRMTNAQMSAISGPPEGLVVYDTTNHHLCYHNGTSWVSL